MTHSSTDTADLWTAGRIQQLGERLRAYHAESAPRPDATDPEQVKREVLVGIAALSRRDGARHPELLRRLGASAAVRLADVANELAERERLGCTLQGEMLLEDAWRAADDTESAPVGDPMQDAALLAFHLTAILGRWDLESVVWEACGVTATPELRDLAVAHQAIRTASRTPPVPGSTAAPRHINHALGRLESALHRPAIVGISGLPYTGRSTLGDHLAHFLHFDVVHANHEEIPGGGKAADAYTEASSRLGNGGRVAIEGAFATLAQREELIELARLHGLSPLLLVCDAPPSIIHSRIRARTGEYESDDVARYRAAAEDWQPIAPEHRRLTCCVSTDGSATSTFFQALDALADLGVAESTLRPESDS